MCQLRKSRIEIKSNLIIHTNTCEIPKLTANNWYNTTVNIIGNSNDETNNNYINVHLAKFKIHTKTFLTDNIRKIY